MEDPDSGDIVKCRWALFELGECADVCNAFPNATLDEVSRKMLMSIGLNVLMVGFTENWFLLIMASGLIFRNVTCIIIEVIP